MKNNGVAILFRSMMSGIMAILIVFQIGYIPVDAMHTIAVETSEITYGDVNGDGTVNVSDAILVLRHIVKMISLDSHDKKSAKVSGDIKSEINITDAILILRYCVGLINQFPVEKPAEAHSTVTLEDNKNGTATIMVLLRDYGNNPITGLSKADFSLYEHKTNDVIGSIDSVDEKEIAFYEIIFSHSYGIYNVDIITCGEIIAENIVVSLEIYVPSNEAEILSYSFAEETAPVEIDSVAGTINVEVYYGTDLAEMIATFTTSDYIRSIQVNGVDQESGQTSNVFSEPITYEVTSEDGTVKKWIVTVREAIFTIIHITDTHIEGRNLADNMRSSFEWIVANKEKYGISIVIHTGDVVDYGHDVIQFRTAQLVTNILYKAGIPLLISPGNHDYDYDNNTEWSAEARSLTRFNDSFGLDKYQHQPWFGGTYEPGNAENVYYLLDIGASECLFIALEHRPRPQVRAWANDVISGYPDRYVFIATHEFLDGSVEAYRRNAGTLLWEDTVSQHSNITHVFSGHVISTSRGTLTNGTHRSDEGIYGNTVHQFYHNWQSDYNRGEGRFRKHKFVINADNEIDNVYVESFMPPGDYLEESNHKFSYKSQVDGLSKFGIYYTSYGDRMLLSLGSIF